MEAISCPKCQEGELVQTDVHEWPSIDPIDGMARVLKHYSFKCSEVLCQYEEDQCDGAKASFLLFSLGIESPLDSDAFTFEATALSDRICDKIETDPSIILARVIDSMCKEQWDKCAELLSILRQSALSENVQQTLNLLEGISFHKVKKSKSTRDCLDKLKVSGHSDTKSFIFVSEILSALYSSQPGGLYQELKDKWFADFRVPYNIPRNFEEPPWDSKAVEAYINRFFEHKVIMRYLVVPLLFELVLKVARDAQSRMREVQFFEQVLKTIKPTKDNTSTADIYWYKNLKKQVNLLAFQALVKEEKLPEAFTYIETTGIDYLALHSNQLSLLDQLNQTEPLPPDLYDENEEYIFVIPSDALPYNPAPTDWIGESDVHQACWQGFYYEIWCIALKYLTVMNFYEQLLGNFAQEDVKKEIENRIIEQTKLYRNNPTLRQELLNWRIPPIVAEVYEHGSNWKEALEYTKLANVDDDEKQKLLSKYQVDDELFKELTYSTQTEQRQVLAYTRLIARLEPNLRRFIRKELGNFSENWQLELRSIFTSRETTNPSTSTQGRLLISDDLRRDILDKLTLDQLLSIIIHDTYWKSVFSKHFSRQSEWIALREDLVPIRNQIAHAIPITDYQLRTVILKTTKLFKLII